MLVAAALAAEPVAQKPKRGSRMQGIAGDILAGRIASAGGLRDALRPDARSSNSGAVSRSELSRLAAGVQELRGAMKMLEQRVDERVQSTFTALREEITPLVRKVAEEQFAELRAELQQESSAAASRARVDAAARDAELVARIESLAQDCLAMRVDSVAAEQEMNGRLESLAQDCLAMRVDSVAAEQEMNGRFESLAQDCMAMRIDSVSAEEESDMRLKGVERSLGCVEGLAEECMSRVDSLAQDCAAMRADCVAIEDESNTRLASLEQDLASLTAAKTKSAEDLDEEIQLELALQTESDRDSAQHVDIEVLRAEVIALEHKQPARIGSSTRKEHDASQGKIDEILTTHGGLSDSMRKAAPSKVTVPFDLQDTWAPLGRSGFEAIPFSSKAPVGVAYSSKLRFGVEAPFAQQPAGLRLRCSHSSPFLPSLK